MATGPPDAVPPPESEGGPDLLGAPSVLAEYDIDELWGALERLEERTRLAEAEITRLAAHLAEVPEPESRRARELRLARRGGSFVAEYLIQREEVLG